MTWLIVALPYVESATDRSLAARAVVSRPTTNDLLSLRDGIEDGRIVGAAVVNDEPREDSLWRAFEWHGSVYVDRACDESLAALIADGWEVSMMRDEYLVLDSPVVDVTDEEPRNHVVRVVERDEFLAGLRAAEPLQTRVPMHERLIDDEQLFGDFVPSRLGGSTALLMLSGARSSGSVVLRNPAALRLDLLDSEEHSLAAHRAAGTVLCRAVGLTASAQPNWIGFEDPNAMHDAWRLSNRSSHAFVVAMELSAPLVDPPVWIPAGQVFQQTNVNGVQTLAVSQATNLVVQPGSTAAVVASAWCLNGALQPPAGQLMQSTPFRVRNDPRSSQADVWVDRDSLMTPA